eukprot:scaffold90631_cov69-Phaeocystis_antarctica.AAC.4
MDAAHAVNAAAIVEGRRRGVDPACITSRRSTRRLAKQEAVPRVGVLRARCEDKQEADGPPHARVIGASDHFVDHRRAPRAAARAAHASGARPLLAYHWREHAELEQGRQPEDADGAEASVRVAADGAADEGSDKEKDPAVCLQIAEGGSARVLALHRLHDQRVRHCAQQHHAARLVKVRVRARVGVRVGVRAGVSVRFRVRHRCPTCGHTPG